MNDDLKRDPRFMAAWATNQSRGNSVHIPERPSRRSAFYAVVAVQLAAVSLVVALFWAVLS
jgi:hypothetical protein